MLTEAASSRERRRRWAICIFAGITTAALVSLVSELATAYRMTGDTLT